MIFPGKWLRRKASRPGYDSVAAYQRHLDSKLKIHRGNRDLAFATAIGASSVALFHEQGDAHVAVLRHHGLADGMAVFDLGCGCGRTAQALQRSGWRGGYIGTDILPGFIAELRAKCPGYEGYVHPEPTIRAADGSLDLVYHWSVFTHLPPEQCFLYLRDTFRALSPGGRTVFSFMEMGALHQRVFDDRVDRISRGKNLNLMDAFLHRDWLARWADQIGFAPPTFTDGEDAANHPPFWQSLAVMTKPA